MIRQSNQIRIVEGWTRDLDLPADWVERAKSGEVEIYNAPRPFPCHEDARGEFVHGIFYGIIDPNLNYADEYRQRAMDLDASLLVFVTRTEVETWGRVYCKELGVDYDDYEFDVIVRLFLQHGGKK